MLGEYATDGGQRDAAGVDEQALIAAEVGKKSRFPAPSMSRISRAGMYRPASLGVRMSASASCMRATPSGESTEYSLMSGSRVRCFLSGLWNDLIVLVLNSSPSFSAMAASRRVAALTLSRSFSAASSAAAAAPGRDGDSSGPDRVAERSRFCLVLAPSRIGASKPPRSCEGTSGAGRSFGSTFLILKGRQPWRGALDQLARARSARVCRESKSELPPITVRYRGSRRMVSIRVCVRCDALSGRAKTRETRKFCWETWPSCHISRCLSLVFSVIRFFRPFGQAEETRG